jgi:uncharacterized protein (TIGR03067 family)
MTMRLSALAATFFSLLLLGVASPKNSIALAQPVGDTMATLDLKKLQGTWEVIQYSHWGTFHKGTKGQTLVFRDDTLTWSGNSGRFVLDTSERPKKLLFTFDKSIAKKPGTVRFTRPCIYMFDDDELLISYIWSNDGDPAPKEFGTGIHLLYRLKRVNP